MRILKSILVCLFMVFAASYCGAVNAMPYTEFRSTSVYMGSPARNNKSQITNYQSQISNQRLARPSGSLTAISASNFAQLNGEGGACYQASALHKPAARRGGRDDMEDEEGDGGNAIGVYDFHSPVGNTPWVLILLLLFAYVIKKQYLCRRFGKDELFGSVK